MSHERRRHRRFTLQLEVTITRGDSGEIIKGSLLELSVGGGFVTAPLKVEAGASVFMRFLYQGQHSCQATGHVSRILPFGENNGIALRFGVANSALQALLRTLGQMPDALQPAVLNEVEDVQLRFA